MRDYEVVYIFKSALGTEDIDARLQRYHEKILAVEGSEITAVEHWGKRQLAYPIDRNENGYYVVVQFSTEPAALPEYERLLKLDDEVLRHLVVLSEGELAVPVPLGDDDGDDDRDSGGRKDEDAKRPSADASDDAAADAGDDADDEEAEGGADDEEAEGGAAADDDSDDGEGKPDIEVVEVEEEATVEADAEGDEDTDEEDKD
jgi:small subunit ribosomal protein S6